MREEIEHRPLLVIALGFALGLAVLAHWPLWILVVLLAFLARSTHLRLALVCSVIVGLVLAPSPPAAGILENQFLRGDAIVVTMPLEEPDRVSTILDWGRGKIWTSFPARFPVHMGERLHIEGLAEPLGEGMDDWALPEGVIGRMRLEPEQIRLVEKAPFLLQLAANWRGRMLDFTERNLATDDAALIDGLCFGATGMLDDERKIEIRKSGVGHIVAASGLHVLILAAALLGLLALTPIPRALALALVAIVLILYALAAGLHPAVIRASLMAVVGSTAYLFRREADALSALSLAAIAVLLWKPESVYNAGFHLTVVVVAALVLFARVGFDGVLWTTPRRLLKSLLVAWAASAPIMALEFGFVPLIGLFLNLAMVVAVVPIILLAMSADLLNFVWHDGGVIVLRAAGVLANGLGWMLDSAGGQRWASVDAPAFSPYWLLVLYGVPLLLWRKHLRRP